MRMPRRDIRVLSRKASTTLCWKWRTRESLSCHAYMSSVVQCTHTMSAFMLGLSEIHGKMQCEMHMMVKMCISCKQKCDQNLCKLLEICTLLDCSQSWNYYFSIGVVHHTQIGYKNAWIDLTHRVVKNALATSKNICNLHTKQVFVSSVKAECMYGSVLEFCARDISHVEAPARDHLQSSRKVSEKTKTKKTYRNILLTLIEPLSQVCYDTLVIIKKLSCKVCVFLFHVKSFHL